MMAGTKTAKRREGMARATEDGPGGCNSWGKRPVRGRPFRVQRYLRSTGMIFPNELSESFGREPDGPSEDEGG